MDALIYAPRNQKINVGCAAYRVGTIRHKTFCFCRNRPFRLPHISYAFFSRLAVRGAVHRYAGWMRLQSGTGGCLIGRTGDGRRGQLLRRQICGTGNGERGTV